jgi:hypothetical protein
LYVKYPGTTINPKHTHSISVYTAKNGLLFMMIPAPPRHAVASATLAATVLSASSVRDKEDGRIGEGAEWR